MPRTLTTSTATEAAKTTGAAPRLVLRIDFGGSIGTKYYAEEALSSPVSAEDRLMNAGECDLRLSGQGMHAVSDITITLSDHDGVLRGYLDSVAWALKRATLYQHFVGGAEADLLPLLVGYIDGAPEWREDERTVAFDVTDAMTGYDVTVGHVAAKSDFPSISPDNEGLMLPLVFGRVPDVKCVQVTNGLKGSLMRDLSAWASTFAVEDGDRFPQGTEITVRVNGEFIYGTMTGKVFAIAHRNAAIWTGTTTENAAGNVHAVYDSAATQRDNVYSGMFLDIGTGYWASRIVRYLGGARRFELAAPIRQDGTTEPVLVGAGTPYAIRGWYQIPTFHFAGSTVEYVQSPVTFYIANDAPSLAVHRVRGLKRFGAIGGGGGAGRDTQQLADVPPECYSVCTADATTFTGLSRVVTTVALTQPLSQIEGGDWVSDELWVEISGYTRDTSSLVQNPADVIRYLLQDFGDIPSAGMDAASFAASAQATAFRRFAFALRERKPMRELIADLTVQAQCQLLVLGGVVHLFHLSDGPGSPQKTFTADEVAQDSILRQWTPLSDLWTEVTAVYAPDVSDRREAKENRFTLVDETAQSAYGRRAGEELNLWAYRDVNQAKAVAQYYLNRRSRVWARMSFRAYLDALALLPLDWVSVGGLAGLASGQCGRIEGMRHAPGSGIDARADQIEYELFLPVYAGCSSTCEVSCEASGCEGSAEHGCTASCETACTATCETSCQESCELVCVTQCQNGCTAGCQQACQTLEEANPCKSGSCESAMEEPQDSCDSVETAGCMWDCMTAHNQSGCSMGGCQGGPNETIPYEFTMFIPQCPSEVTRGQAFDITIEIRINGSLEHDYVPTAGMVLVLLNAEDANDAIAPVHVDATGWANGTKTLSCTITGGTKRKKAQIRATDLFTGGSARSAVIVIQPPVALQLSVDQEVVRTSPFQLSIAGVTLPGNSPDTSYVPQRQVVIDNEQGYNTTPTTVDNSGWVSGARSVTMAMSGSGGTGTLRLTATDADSGRKGVVEVTVYESSMFVLSAPASIARGIAFNVTIQAVLNATGAADTSYTPSGNVAISLAEKQDAADAISPTFTANSGWSSGAKTVSCTVTGGSGGDSIRVSATDAATGRTGYVDVLVGDGVAVTTTANSKRLRKYHSEGARATPYTQATLDAILEDALAASVSVYAFASSSAALQLASYQSYGGGSNGEVARCAMCFDTSGVASGTPLFLRFLQDETFAPSVYFRDEASYGSYRWCQIHNTQTPAVIVAKGTWSGAAATASDWDAFETSGQVSTPLSRLAYKSPSPDEVTGSGGTALVLKSGARLIRVPDALVTYGGVTKLMVMISISPNPCRILDCVGHSASPAIDAMTVRIDFPIDALVHG